MDGKYVAFLSESRRLVTEFHRASGVPAGVPFTGANVAGTIVASGFQPFRIRDGQAKRSSHYTTGLPAWLWLCSGGAGCARGTMV